MTLAQSIRGVLRRDVILICAVIFCANLVAGILAPTFSIFAQGLGASLTLIGILSTTVGVTQLIGSMPMGLQSDRFGRKMMLMVGLLAFAVATLLFALAPSPWLLFPGRILIGLASVATFSIGAAYMGDVIRPEERGVAFGLYTSAMGLGFAIGPLVGAALATAGGIRASYVGGTIIGLVGAGLAAWGLRDTRTARSGVRSQRVGFAWGEMSLLLRNPGLLVGSLGNFLTNLTFSGAIVNFFPLYATGFGATLGVINAMFSVRAFVSTVSRFPIGMLSRRLSGWLMITLSLALTLIVMYMLASTASLVLMGVLLVVEGIAYGMLLTVGQAFVVEHSTPATRGTTMGVYSTSGSIGSTFSPLVLGVVADILGLRAVLLLSAGLTLIGLIIIGVLYMRLSRKVES